MPLSDDVDYPLDYELGRLSRMIGERSANLLAAMLAFGEQDALARTTEDDPNVIAQARASYATFHAPWWVAIERRYDYGMMVGPYPDDDAAQRAMNNAPLINALCEKDCLDYYITHQQPEPHHEQVIINPNNPDHIGH